MKGLTLGLSQQVVEAGSGLILVTQERAESSSVNAVTVRNCQTGWARQARREGVRMQEPAVEPPQVRNRLQPGGYGPDSSARLGAGYPGRLRSRSGGPVGRPRGKPAAYSWRSCRGTVGHLTRRSVSE